MANTPITAKIKRTTQGGMVQQPLLNMGAPVKMKMSSPAKNNTNARRKANESRTKARQATAAANKAAELKKAKELSSKEFVKNRRGRKVKNPKYKKPSTESVKNTGSDYTPVRTDNANPVPYAFRQDAKLNGGSKSGVKGKMGSDTRKAEYDKRNWAYDETISTKSLATKDKPKVKATKTIKPVKTVKGNTSPKSVKIETKLSVAKPSKKTARASKVRAKGEAALASGNLSKARRLKRREERIKERAAKKASK